MKTELRLGSVVPHGAGGSEAAMIDIVYIFLLSKYGQNVYSRIGINQIGEDLKEFVARESGNRIHVNIRYPADEDFENKTDQEKNKIRLNVIHTALLRIVEQYGELDVTRLQEIKLEILAKKFLFDFIVKEFVNKNNKLLRGQLVIHSSLMHFDYYILIYEDDKLKCRIQLYRGQTVMFFGEEFFYYGTWKNNNELIITGKNKEVESHVFVDNCKINFVNLTKFDNPPYFTLMRADITEEEREKAYKDWHLSLDPSHLEILKRERASWY